MMENVFQWVALSLHRSAQIIGISYNEINVIVYYFFIPLSWLVVLDHILEFHYLKASFLLVCFGFVLGCRDFRSYSNWLFNKSVIFLNAFNGIGSNYVKSSVWVCAIGPMFIYPILSYFIIF